MNADTTLTASELREIADMLDSAVAAFGDRSLITADDISLIDSNGEPLGKIIINHNETVWKP